MTLPTKPIRRTQSAEQLDLQLNELLEVMLDANTEISYRSLIRGLEGVTAPSSLTRDDYRRALVTHYQELQSERRHWVEKQKKTSLKGLTDELARKDLQIAELERQAQILAASHKAVILAVGEIGGMKAWREFFESYSNSLNLLKDDATR